VLAPVAGTEHDSSESGGKVSTTEHEPGDKLKVKGVVAKTAGTAGIASITAKHASILPTKILLFK